MTGPAEPLMSVNVPPHGRVVLRIPVNQALDSSLRQLGAEFDAVTQAWTLPAYIGERQVRMAVLLHFPRVVVHDYATGERYVRDRNGRVELLDPRPAA